MAEATGKIEQVTIDPKLDYVDVILCSKTQGRMTDIPNRKARVQRFSDAKDPWFYLHVQDAIAKSDGPITEMIPLAEHLSRYDRGGFWVGALAFDYFKMPFNDYTRWWLDDFLHTRMMYMALHVSGQPKKCVIQDLALPFRTAEQFVDYTDKFFGIYSLWLCPLRQSQLPIMHPHIDEVEADGQSLKPMLNIGLWRFGPPQWDDFVQANRNLERKLRELGGMKWLYAQMYYTEDEFWQMYDQKWDAALREKYNATSLLSVHEKVKIDINAEESAIDAPLGSSLVNKWPFSGLYGIKKAIDSGTYLQARKPAWRSIGEGDRFGINR